jgi:hypothetical protein
MSISSAQRSNLNNLELFAGEDITQFVEVNSALDRVAKKFLENLENNINQAKFAGSGSLVKNMTYRKSDDGKSVDIILNNYYDYVNQGVKGWGSSKNAPNSPYSYSRKAKSSSNGEFRKSITDYVNSGKARIANVRNDRALGIGIERKSLIDAKVDTLMYLIRRFGVKATNYFTKTVNESRDDIELIIAEAVGKDIVLKFKVK